MNTAKPRSIVIALPDDAGKFIQHIGTEAQEWIDKLTGNKPAICKASQVTSGHDLISISGAGIAHGMTANPPLDEEEFILKTISEKNQRAIVCLGGSEAAIMYAVYELLEKLGIMFQMTETIIPETIKDLELPELDIRKAPKIKTRGYNMAMAQTMWMGLKEFKSFVRQMARMKLNCVMLSNFFDTPFHNPTMDGEDNGTNLGYLTSAESGYLALISSVGRHTLDELKFGRERFAGPRPCAPEFWHVQTPAEAKEAAVSFLSQMIDYAHFHKISVYLGIHDFPCVPANRVHQLKTSPTWAPWYGYSALPGDPLIDKVWLPLLDNLLSSQPNLDGIHIFLSEHSYPQKSGPTNSAMDEYHRLADEMRGKHGHLCKSLEEIREAGMHRPADQETLDFSFALTNHLVRIINEVRIKHQDRRFGISGCGHMHLFPMLDAALDQDIAIMSVESCCCWCKDNHIPLEWAELESGRDTWLMPRISDDAAVFGPQWNVELYTHDRIHIAEKFGFNGILAQTVGNWSGLEQNADFLARSYWEDNISYSSFYQNYCSRWLGPDLADRAAQAYEKLEEVERSMGRDARVPHDGVWAGYGYFTGLNNFLAHYDIPGVVTMFSEFARLTDPFDGPNWSEKWDVKRYCSVSTSSQLTHFEGFDYDTGMNGRFIENSIYRLEKFNEVAEQLRSVSEDFIMISRRCPPGSEEAVNFIIYKLNAFRSHLISLSTFLRTWVVMDRSFALFYRGEKEEASKAFIEMMVCYDAALSQTAETCRMMAASPHIKPDEDYLLFRYQVRVLNPAEEFREFLVNMKNFHTGKGPFWNTVKWEAICLPLDGDRGQLHW